jgi:glycogen operon protein
VTRGNPLPLGASVTGCAVNFAVISRHASRVTLVISDPLDPSVATEISLDRAHNRTGDHWHARISGLPEQFSYGYRVDDPEFERNSGRQDPILLDPAAHILSGGQAWGNADFSKRRSLMINSDADAQAHHRPQIPWEDTILYELHVRGYTIHPSSGVRHPGTFAGLIEKLRYLQELNVTAIELLPIDEFDELDCPYVNPVTGERLRNFWGYSPIAFATPKAAYSSRPDGLGPWEELSQLTSACHDSSIEIILDTVFNHTAERGDGGPTYSLRGLDKSLYYMFDDSGRYLDYSGCGNTLNGNHPAVRALLLSKLRHTIAQAGVDGFRFDLAAALGRDRHGCVLSQPPVIEAISEDPLLSCTKLIAEPWDASGLYQVGSFPGGGRWAEWNGRYRDGVRRFWRGEPGMTSELATRLCGSDDLYGHLGPLNSINFITCHDGFTLADLVSYNHKHNVANGEGSRDGTDANWSWNCGDEGSTDEPSVLVLRRRQVRNLVATLLISQGVPMLLGGDEFLRTQRGNNNAWCQDNDISWVDWGLAETNADFLRFVRQMIAFRQRHPVLRRRTFPNPAGGGPPADLIWHGVEPFRPDWSYESHSLALTLDGRRCDRPGVLDRDIYIAMNSSYEPLTFKIPSSPSGWRWRRVVDTALASPNDIVDEDEGPVVEAFEPYRIESHAMVVLVAEGPTYGSA